MAIQFEEHLVGDSDQIRLCRQIMWTRRGRWRKRKGFATVRLSTGAIRRVELHWYEAHGIGRRDFKIKAYADQI